MRAISLWQPWAQWVALEWKKIETRRHGRFACLAGERIGIHAAKKWDCWAFNAAFSYMTHEQRLIFLNMPRSNSGLLCTAFVEIFELSLNTGHSAQALTRCRKEMSGLFLKDVKLLPKPLKIPGRQGIFHVPDRLFEISG